MMPLLAALAAAGLWYAGAWAILHYPFVMSKVLIYGLAPAAVGFAGWSAVWMWRATRVDARASAAKQAQWAAEDAAWQAEREARQREPD